MNKDLKKLNFRKFWLYIHENGQFWPKADFEPITIRSDEYKVLKFSISKEFKVTTLFYFKKKYFIQFYFSSMIIVMVTQTTVLLIV